MNSKNILVWKSLLKPNSLQPTKSTVCSSPSPPVGALQIRGESVDTFICEAQDRARNAHSKSVAAAWNVWSELLQQDQITFEAERISSHVCKKMFHQNVPYVPLVFNHMKVFRATACSYVGQ